MKVNALRAADILRHNAQSRWWFARHSKSHAGGDTHGILCYLLRWREEGRPMSRLLRDELEHITR